MPVDPTRDDFRRYMTEDPGGPVVMLNLLKYKPGGRESYRAYGRALQDYLPKIGAEVLYAGNCSTTLVAPEAWDWDALLIVRYPSRETFMNIVRDPEHQKVTHLRTEALTEAVLQATVPGYASSATGGCANSVLAGNGPPRSREFSGRPEAADGDRSWGHLAGLPGSFRATRSTPSRAGRMP